MTEAKAVGTGDKAADPKIKKLFGYTVPKWAQKLKTDNDPHAEDDADRPEEHTIGDIFTFLTDKKDVKDITVDDLQEIDGLDETVTQRVFGGDWDKMLDFIVKQRNNEAALWTCYDNDKKGDIVYIVSLSIANFCIKNPRHGFERLH